MSRRYWNFPHIPMCTHASPPHYQHNVIPLYGTHNGMYQRHFKNIPHPRVVHWIHFLKFVVFTSLKVSNLKTALRLLGHPLFSKAIGIFLHKAITREKSSWKWSEHGKDFFSSWLCLSLRSEKKGAEVIFVSWEEFKDTKLVGIESMQRAGEQWNEQELFMESWI